MDLSALITRGFDTTDRALWLAVVDRGAQLTRALSRNRNTELDATQGAC